MFFTLKSLSKAFFLAFINKSEAYFLIFSIQVSINYLNCFLMENKATKAKAMIKAGLKVKT